MALPRDVRAGCRGDRQLHGSISVRRTPCANASKSPATSRLRDGRRPSPSTRRDERLDQYGANASAERNANKIAGHRSHSGIGRRRRSLRRCASTRRRRSLAHGIDAREAVEEIRRDDPLSSALFAERQSDRELLLEDQVGSPRCGGRPSPHSLRRLIARTILLRAATIEPDRITL